MCIYNKVIKNNKITILCIPIVIIFSFFACRFMDPHIDDFNPPGDEFFIHQSTISPFHSTLTTTLYDFYAFTADSNGVISILNIQNSMHPFLISSIELPTSSTARKSEVDWRYNLYIAAGAGGVFIIDSSNPTNPRIVNEINYIYARDLSFQEDFIAIIDNFGWKLFYLITNTQLSELNSFEFLDGRQPLKILLRDNWIFTFSDYHLDIFDVTNIYNIQHEGSIPLPNRFVDFTIINEFIVILTTNDLLYIDISSPLFSEVKSQFRLGLTPRVIESRNNLLYIGWENRTFSVYIVFSIDREPSEESRISLPQTVRDIDIKDDNIYLTLGSNGIEVYYYWK